jgi:hypothetical protein
MNYVQHDLEGRILCVGKAPLGSDLSVLGLVITQDAPFDVNFLEDYVQDGAIVSRPSQPSPHHEWDWTTKSWLPNLPAAITSRKNAIDQERDRRINSPLTYNGKNLDADARARENLKSKLEEIKSREALSLPMPTSMLVWRDADNVTHSWPTQEAYKAWLEGFTVAMSERGTMNYAAAWQHKANIASLTTIEDIMNYNVEEGWNG